MRRLLPLAVLLFAAGCISARDSKRFESRLNKLEKEVNHLRIEVSEAKGEVSSAAGKVKALEENYRILLREVEKLKRNRKRKR